MRAASAARAAARPRGPAVHRVEAVETPRPGRLYRPGPAAEAIVVYLHGGGFVSGGLDSHDRTCRRLALQTGAAVLAVDWRLAPEHPWPAGVKDAVAAVRWARERFQGPLAVGGDSAGGCVAALACLALRDAGEGELVAAQLLANPNTDLTL